MVKEIERAGIPTAHIATIIPISLTIGANRIVPGLGIPHPLGDPKQSAQNQYNLRKELVLRALKALQTPVTGQTVFE
jgi:glycine reductase